MVLKRFAIVLAALIVSAGLSHLAFADERILDYDSVITVNPDASVSVTESITVQAENNQIRHGIYRDFPLDYVDNRGNHRSATFDLQNVTLDGDRVPYHSERRGADIRIYVGDANSFVQPGEHTYRISYVSERQLGFYKDFDEIYWNVTGNKWAFPIDKAAATIYLPQGATIGMIAAYTGPLRSQGTNYEIVRQSGNELRIQTKEPMPAHYGLTVAVSFPKGYVAEPSTSDKAEWFLRDNASVFAGLIGLAATLVYFTMMWLKVGRDPAAGVIIPQYEPPPKFTPGACRYVREMGYDKKAFTAAIVNMAVKGAIKIREEDSVYTIEKADDPTLDKLSKGERSIFNKLLGSDKFITLKQSNHTEFSSAQRALKRALAGEFERDYFRRNTGYVLPGAAIALLTLAAVILLSPRNDQAFGMTAWLAGWSVGCYFLLQRVKLAWLGVINAPGLGSRVGSGISAVFMTIFALPFMVGLILGTGAIGQGLSYIVIAIIAMLVISCLAFYHLMKAPTRLGRQILDHIEGFKKYLSVAEKDRMEFHNPPDRTPELFEKFLPYAIALDVENQWSEQFNDVLAKASIDGTYHPTWYYGPGFYPGHYGNIGHNLGSGLTSAVAVASAAPRSSGSGSGGGGFSGGGGGGGGGGGW